MRKGQKMRGKKHCSSCQYHGTGWAYVGIQDLDGRWINGDFVATKRGELAVCPSCGSSVVVRIVR